MEGDQHLQPLASGLVSPAEARCTAPPADRGVLSGSLQAADTELGENSCGVETGAKHFNVQTTPPPPTHTQRLPNSLWSPHPFYVLDNFIDVWFINLNLLPEKTRLRSLAGGLPRCCCCCCWSRLQTNASYSSARCFSLVFAWLIFSVLLRSICLFSSFFSL